MLTSALAPLAERDRWVALVASYAAANRRRVEKVRAYAAVVESGEWERVADGVLRGTFTPEPAVEALVNKADGRRKRVFQLPPREELLCKLVNRLLQPAAIAETSPACHSFLPGSGARAAFGALLRSPSLGAQACLRLDVSDYFNSIDVARLMAALPESFAADAPVRSLLAGLLCDPSRGVMAGTPLAPMLANLYLRDLDDHFVVAGVTYSRYSDDIIVFGTDDEIALHDRHIRAHLAACGLTPNESKSGRSPAGVPWDYLGFRYDAGVIDLSLNTRRKLRAKVTRLSRKLDRQRNRFDLDAPAVVGRFVKRLNRTLYGVPSDAEGFCWATWFFPLLTTDATLADLDAHVQQKLRFAATGRHNARAHRLAPYALARDAGYLPLRTAWRAHRRGHAAYDALVLTRCLPPPPSSPAASVASVNRGSGDQGGAEDREKAVAAADHRAQRLAGAQRVEHVDLGGHADHHRVRGEQDEGRVEPAQMTGVHLLVEERLGPLDERVEVGQEPE
jgi:hypothetical protein